MCVLCFIFRPLPDAGFTRMLTYFGLTLEELLADARLLRAVLGFHVVPTRVMAADIPAERTQLQTFRCAGRRLRREVGGGGWGWLLVGWRCSCELLLVVS